MQIPEDKKSFRKLQKKLANLYLTINSFFLAERFW